ncbi:hypothetical protein [Weissella sp. MSCH1]|uniref:hypothetical protein n=1 Tax=Weissella sp. MSCH1 TaxID=3383343 RepID=UPI003896B944
MTVIESEMLIKQAFGVNDYQLIGLKALIFRFSLSGLGTIQKTLKALITSVISAFLRLLQSLTNMGNCD